MCADNAFAGIVFAGIGRTGIIICKDAFVQFAFAGRVCVGMELTRIMSVWMVCIGIVFVRILLAGMVLTGISVVGIALTGIVSTRIERACITV